jgi:hypothetical protein
MDDLALAWILALSLPCAGRLGTTERRNLMMHLIHERLSGMSRPFATARLPYGGDLPADQDFLVVS